jgi:hypothetical protein
MSQSDPFWTRIAVAGVFLLVLLLSRLAHDASG